MNNALPIAKIKELNAPEMQHFEKFFKQSLKSNVPLLDSVMRYIIRRKGKQMRPMLVFLSAKIAGEVTQSTYTAAALIELLHTATLVHDDVVDDAAKRRGFFSVYALWKSKIAVLTGDFLLSKGLLLSVKHKEFDLLEIVSEAVKEMAEGELLQIEKARRLNISEEDYLKVIHKKTASLIAACTATGAKSANADAHTIEKLKTFGKYAGIVFQIKDDLFDYQTNNLTGKPSGNDIKERKITLPLIYALQKCSFSKKQKILHILRFRRKNPKQIRKIISFVEESGGIQYAEEKMNFYKDKALTLLDDFPDNEAKFALQGLIEYIVERKK
ncbi:MAG: polyprenyl synthetase [Bacteroidia bacterium]|nr:MAG: polyprenyl synthetase [Bacteroidia bacterium]